MIRKIFKTGHSLAITLSPKMLTAVGLSEGDTVGISMDDSNSIITIRPEKRNSQLSLKLTSRPRLGTKLHEKK